MTSNENNLNFGPPPPITKLTMEQDLKLRILYDHLTKPETRKEDIITLFMALQQQCYVLGNSITNLVNKWPTQLEMQLAQLTTKEVEQMFGTLSETKD